MDTDSCARTHAHFNVSAVTARVHVRLNRSCTREISSKTAILSSMDYARVRSHEGDFEGGLKVS